jgi:hypothetical protein
LVEKVNEIKNIVIFFVTFLACMNVERVGAQSFALRTNLLYDATLSPNLGAEVRLSSAWAAGINVGLNAWDIDKSKNKKWRHLLVAPNIRHYFNQKGDSLYRYSLSGRYLEFDAIYSHFNVGNTKIPFGIYTAIQDRRLQGDLLALGSKYGYSWILARDWRIEAEAGVAIGYAWFKEYDCDHCGTYYGKGDRIFLLPQLGINVVYIIN